MLYYEGPLMFWYPCEGRHLLALACEAKGEGDYPVLLCELSNRQAKGFLDRELKLRHVVFAAERWYLVPEYFAPVLTFEFLDTLPEGLPEMDGYLPEPA